MEIEELRQLAAEDPDDHLVRYVLGTRLLEEPDGDPAEAAQHLAAVLTKDPQHVATYLALGRAYMCLHQHEAARQALTEGLRIAGGLAHGEGRDLMPEFEEMLSDLG